MLKYFTPNRTRKATEEQDTRSPEDAKPDDQDIQSPENPETNHDEESHIGRAQAPEPSSAESLVIKNSEGNTSSNGSGTENIDTTKQDEPQKPVLRDEDEKFLEAITSEDQATAPMVQPTIILDDGRRVEGEEAIKALRERAASQNLDTENAVKSSTGNQKSPKTPKVSGFPSQAEAEAVTMAGTQLDPTLEKNDRDESADQKKKASSYWTYLPSVPNMPAIPAMANVQLPSMSTSTMFPDRSRERMANTLQSAAEAFKAGEGVPLNPDGTINQEEAAKQQAHDLSNTLSKLNLSAINNRVFSLSQESQDLLENFNVVLRDLINGGPTAYHDLEKLLDERSKQLSHMWSQLPPFVQTLVKSLPAKIGSSLGPELFAAAAESPDAKMSASTSSAATGSASELTLPGEKGKKKSSKKSTMPSVKNLVTEKGAVAQMLRSILNFLKARFPAFMSGTNILMSLAVFSKLIQPWPSDRNWLSV